MKTKKTVEQMITDGELIKIDEFTTRKEGFNVPIALPKKDYNDFLVDKNLGSRKDKKKVITLIRAVMWMVVKCQRQNVKANSVVKLDAAGYPPLVMTIHPLSNTSNAPVIVVQRNMEEVVGHA